MISFWFTLVEEEIMQSADQVIMRLISQLSKGISRGLQRLFKYFNGTVILTSFLISSAGVFL